MQQQQTAQQVRTVKARLAGGLWLDWQAVRRAVQAAAEEARREARRHGKTVRCPFVRSRGRLLATTSAAGQCLPHPEAEAPSFGGTKKEVVELVQRVQAQYPDVTEIYIAGGYDIADRIDFDDYEPRVSEWSVVVWTRGGGWCARPEVMR
jgi:hypothetical protein